jgi:hypothetical protein
VLSAVSTRMPTVTMPPPWMSAARCSARRALRLRRPVTASSFAGCRASASSSSSPSSRPAPTRPGWSAICARKRCACSRSTSPIHTHAGGSARATRAALAGKARAIPKQTDGVVESIRQLRVARQGAVKARSAALAQLRDLLVTAPEPLRAQLSEPKTLRGTASRCRRLRPALGELEHPAQAARFALRSLARRIGLLDEEVAALDRQLGQLVHSAAPRTTALLGISTGHAGQLLVSAGQNVERLRGEASFAALCGASPLPASAGKTKPPPPQLRRRPRRQPRAAPDRRLPSALLPAHACLREAASRRRQNQGGHSPLPQALHRA